MFEAPRRPISRQRPGTEGALRIPPLVAKGRPITEPSVLGGSIAPTRYSFFMRFRWTLIQDSARPAPSGLLLKSGRNQVLFVDRRYLQLVAITARCDP